MMHRKKNKNCKKLLPDCQNEQKKLTFLKIKAVIFRRDSLTHYYNGSLNLTLPLVQLSGQLIPLLFPALSLVSPQLWGATEPCDDPQPTAQTNPPLDPIQVGVS